MLRAFPFVPIILLTIGLAVHGLPAWSAEATLAPPPKKALTASPAPTEAKDIAASIIRLRAFEFAGSGNQDLAMQLEALARGLSDGSFTLADAALVMQIATSGEKTAPAVVIGPEAKAAIKHTQSLLDGEPAPLVPAAPGPAAGQPGTTPLPTTLPMVEKALVSKVYAVELGADGKANVAAIGLGTHDGITIGQSFVLKRNGKDIAQAKAVMVKESMSYAEIVKGSLTDPQEDVHEGDQAVLKR